MLYECGVVSGVKNMGKVVRLYMKDLMRWKSGNVKLLNFKEMLVIEFNC